MKLVLICGSLEPGKDGVGDYTRRLGEYCREQGHTVLLVGLNDPWIATDQFSASEIRLSRAEPSQTRQPRTLFQQGQSYPTRLKKLQAELAAFQPDWISLQFVPYAYHRRGFCHELAAHLSSIAPEKTAWHIMFHELWLGLNSADSLKFKLLGWVQRRATLRLHRNLRPRVIHTHAYQHFLQRENIHARKLPLFSNIEIHPPAFTARLNPLQLDSKNGRPPFTAVFFGSLHPEWTPECLMQKLRGKNPIFLSLGRLGSTGETQWNSFADRYKTEASFIRLGELSPAEISTALQIADAGIATSPWNLIEKSGSVAAMIEHGLPVIVTRNDFLPAENFTPDPSWAAQLHPIWTPDFNLTRLKKRPPASALPEIGSRFLADLT